MILPNVIVVAESGALRSAALPRVAALYAHIPVSISAVFDSQATTLLLSASSVNADAAIAWSGALSHALVDRMKNDPYVDAQLLDPAEGAGITGKKARLLSFGAVFVLALFSFVLVAFAAQRLEEARDVAGALRRKGVRVLGSIATGRRHRRKADRLAAIVAALIQDDYEEGRVVVTALTDPSLAEWLADLLAEGESDLAEIHAATMEPDAFSPFGATQAGEGDDRLGVVVGPLLDQLCLRALVEHEYPACVLAVDARTSSVSEIAAGVRTLERAGVTCRGVVLINDARRPHRPKGLRTAFSS